MKSAEHLHIEVGDKRLKENIRHILKESLSELGILKATGKPDKNPVDQLNPELTLEQRERLLILQLEQKKM